MPPSPASASLPRWTFRAAIFLGALLLFSLEPLVAKRILPWFGGSAAVWITCLVFFQCALLLGYLYARSLPARISARAQGSVHLGLLIGSLLLLPIGPSLLWRSSAAASPFTEVLLLLTATIGVPFLLLSATGPLLQSWYARVYADEPYRLYALSNIASLAALLAYPTLVEPWLPMAAQRWVWSALYVIFVALCGYIARASGAFEAPATQTPGARTEPGAALLWFCFSAAGSMLLLAVTNHITTNIAPVPLLWILPLALYLGSFAIAFAKHNWFRPLAWSRALLFALGILAYALYDINTVLAPQVGLPIFLVGLFICCLYCHSELNARRPEAKNLATFYLVIAAGGACGALFVGVLAPLMFGGVYELPAALLFLSVVVLAGLWREQPLSERALWAGTAVACAAVLVQNVQAYHKDTLALRRSFYGSLRVLQSQTHGQQTRLLFHGTIEHGAQFLVQPMRSRPTTYYGADSGIGIVLRECFPAPMRVAVVGLGVGTIAAYGRPGDEYRFYEINSQVEEIAGSLFTYLRESQAKTSVTLGDARLSLENATDTYSVIALDAFSGDAVPVHLLTREAMAVYEQRLKAGGALAFHVSNDYLDLANVVRLLAEERGYRAMLVRNHSDDEEMVLPSDWVIVSRNPVVNENASLKIHQIDFAAHPHLRTWTDDRNDLWQVLKTPALK